MIRKKGEKVPDAWDDDDWEAQADRAAKEPPKQEPAPALNKAERMELHRESNRKLWESAYALLPPPPSAPLRSRRRHVGERNVLTPGPVITASRSTSSRPTTRSPSRRASSRR